MTPKTKAALEKSIKHWEKNVAAKTCGSFSMGVGDCALCGLFFIDDCCGCPVANATGKYCEDSPYERVEDALDEDDYPDAHKSAKEELEFLKRLRS